MTDRREIEALERRLARTLHAAAPIAPPDLADRLLRQTAAQPQRRGWSGFSFMSVLAASAAVLVAVAVGLQIGNLLPRGNQVGTGSESPTPTASAPSSTARPSPSVSPSPAGDRCENEALGYSVTVPSGWHANEAVVPEDESLTPIAACQYFGEQPLEIAPNAGVPLTVAIGFSRVSGSPVTAGEVVISEEMTVAGRPATVVEIAGTGDGPFFGDGDFAYRYEISLPDGAFLVADTISTRNGDYEAHKAVLDAMMETLELTGA